MSDFTAIYLPSRTPDREDPSRSGFVTKEEANEYVFSQMCTECKAQRALFLSGAVTVEDTTSDPEEWPSCSFEWIVVPTDKADGSFDELMEVAGWTTVYTRPPQDYQEPLRRRVV